jgi:hypothetical protein
MFERAGLAVAAIVEKRGELSVRCRKHLLRRRGDGGGLSIVEIEALNPQLIHESGNVFLLPRYDKDAPPRVLRIIAAQSPMPDEQPDEDTRLRHQLLKPPF